MVGHAPLEGGILVRVQVPQHEAQQSAAGSKPMIWFTSWTRRDLRLRAEYSMSQITVLLFKEWRRIEKQKEMRSGPGPAAKLCGA